MNILLFIAGLLLVYLGAIGGAIIAHFSEKELPDGKKYFKGLERALVVLFLLVPLLFGMEYGILLLIVLIAMAMALLKSFDRFAYTLFAIILPYSAIDSLFFSTMTFIAFLYGLPSGTKISGKKLSTRIIHAAKIHAPFVIIAFLLGILLSVLSIAP